MGKVKENYLLYVIFAIICVFSFSLLNSRGGVDIDDWLKWIDNISKYGLVKGYAANQDVYPPLTNVIFYLVLKFSVLTNISAFVSLKLFIFIFLLLTSFTFLVWTKNWLFAIATLIGFTLNTMALTYVDIFTAPFLLISLYALYKKNLLIFTIFYFVNIMIKWQALIILPFIAVYILNISSFNEIKNIKWKEITYKIILPVFVLTTLIVIAFGGEIYNTLKYAMTPAMLSGYALNFNWILTRVYYFLKPGVEFFEDGIMKIIWINGGKITYPGKILFIVFYFTTLLAFFKEEKNFINMLKFSVIGFLAYFMFNLEVHENHLFVTALLSLVILIYDRKFLAETIGIFLAFNLNMFLFYGFFGEQPFVHGYFGADMSVILSVLFIVFFLILYFPVLKVLKKNFLKSRVTL